MTMARFRLSVEKLGYEVGEFGKHGNFEAVGVPKAVRDAFRSLPTDQMRLAEIGVLCARRVDTDRVRSALGAAGIETVILQSGPDDRSIPGVRITTMHRAKGLEFFAVAIPFLSDGSFPPQGALKSAVDAADRDDIVCQYRSLLHVAATRAKKALRVSWSGQPTNLFTGLK
jgi:hypothetical protein